MGKIEEGDKIPEFKLLNQDSKIVDIWDYIGKSLVIYFYPKDDTFGCTREACAFRDEYQLFHDMGATIFGISEDSVSSHRKFVSKFNLPFDLLSDEGNKIRKTFGVPADLFGFIPGRVTYILDYKGIVRHIHDNQFNFKGHVVESIQVINNFSSKP